MLDNSICAGSGVVAGTVILQNEALSIRQEIGELIMFESGVIEMNLIAVPVSADDVLLEFDVPVTAGTRPLKAKIRAPSRDVTILIGQVTVFDDRSAQVAFLAVSSYPVISFVFVLDTFGGWER